MNKIEYKIKSTEYHKDFNTFTLKKGETYFLLGKNGIGKSTLIKYFTHKRRKEFYDIEFDVTVTKKSLREYFSKAIIPKETLENIISEWKEIPIKVSYNNLNNQKDTHFETIKNKITNHIVKLNKSNLLKELKKISKTFVKFDSDLLNFIKKIEKELKAPIVLENITHKDYEKSNNYKRQIQNINEIKKNINKTHGRIEKTISKIEQNKNIIYKDLPSVGNYYFDIPDTLKIEIKQLRESTQKVSEIFSNQLVEGGGFYFDDLLFTILINIGKYVDFNSRNEFSNFNKEISRGDEVMNSLKTMTKWAEKESYITGYAIDEPFNSLDSVNIQEARKLLDKIPGTKLITSHDTNSIKATDLANVIVMFEYKGKRGIANFTQLKKLTKEDRDGTAEVTNQINSILNNWFSQYKEKVLMVEGFKDYEILNNKLDGIVVIPMGGANLVQGAISYYSTLSRKIKFLFDRDEPGLLATSQLLKVKKDGDISKKIFGKSKLLNFEELITGESFDSESLRKSKKIKTRLFNEIMDGKHNEKLDEIVQKIIKEFE